MEEEEEEEGMTAEQKGKLMTSCSFFLAKVQPKWQRLSRSLERC
jgi:hypothetical protein